jgi:hypothetical protein
LEANLDEKVLQTPNSMEKSWTWWCVPVIPATRKLKIGGPRSRPVWAKSKTLSQRKLKQNKLEVWFKW